jgi:hypothetical protein
VFLSQSAEDLTGTDFVYGQYTNTTRSLALFWPESKKGEIKMSDYVTLKVLARRSSLSEKTLRRFIRCKELPHYRADPKGKILIRLSDFNAWIESRRIQVEKDVDAKEMLELLFASAGERQSA